MIVTDDNYPIALRDGIVTFADVYRPATGRYPVLLVRQPYSRRLGLTLATAFSDGDPYQVASRGYVVVVQDGRGAPGSGGILRPFEQELEDGYDSVQACAEAPWSDGSVGMLGRSYIGFCCWLAAVMRPPALKAIAPGITGSGTYGWAYESGAFQLGFALTWAASWIKDLPRVAAPGDRSSPGNRDHTRFMRTRGHLSDALAVLPLFGMDGLRIGSPPVPYYEWLEHPDRDEYWERTDVRRRYADVLVPSLNMGGWYDLFLQGTIENYLGVTAAGGSDSARRSSLVCGPWSHDNPYRSYLGELSFGEHADPVAFGLDNLQLSFFDYWLKGIDEGYGDRPLVQIFTMGENRWRSEATWPPDGAVTVRYHLRSSGAANTMLGDGRLDQEPPDRDEPPDAFLYDPRDPVPTWGGRSRVHGVAPKGPLDQRRIEMRGDVLVYVSRPLAKPVEMTGPIELELWATTSAEDTDFTGKLLDIYPDGRRIPVADGIIRARYRRSQSNPVPVPRHEPVRYQLSLGDTSNLFRAGHAIGIEISCSDFPRFDRNLNTGGPLGREQKGIPAAQAVLHTPSYPSALIATVIPR